MPGSARAVHRGHVDLRNSPAKIRQAKGAAPRFSTSLCPVSILESAQLKIDGKQRTACDASLFPRPTSSVMHTLAELRKVFRSTRSARPRVSESPSMSMRPEVIFDPPQAEFP